MTREEAMFILMLAKSRVSYDRLTEALDIAIKVLGQEFSVLDKIRAEIIELRSRQNVGVLECLDIIDKYKESEVQDADSD